MGCVHVDVGWGGGWGWLRSAVFHLTGRTLTAWSASPLWSLRKWKDSVFSPLIMVIFVKLEIHFSSRVDVL